jgi:hypothetical protein
MLSRAAHTNTGASPVQRKRYPGTKSAKNLNMTDLVEAIGKIPLKTDMKTKGIIYLTPSICCIIHIFLILLFGVVYD